MALSFGPGALSSSPGVLPSEPGALLTDPGALFYHCRALYYGHSAGSFHIICSRPPHAAVLGGTPGSGLVVTPGSSTTDVRVYSLFTVL